MSAAVLVTRPGGESDPLVEHLRAAGRRVHAVPTVAVEPLEFDPPDLRRFDWVVVTSAAGARAALDRCAQPGLVGWAAVGPRTASVLASRGVTAAAVPEEHRGVRVVEAMAGVEPIGGRRVLLLRADASSDGLPRALREAGALVEELAAYHTVIGPETSRQAVADALADTELGGVVFASGSAVRGLIKLASGDPRHLPAMTIGPSTSKVARAEGFRVVAEASARSLEALLVAIADHI